MNNHTAITSRLVDKEKALGNLAVRIVNLKDRYSTDHYDKLLNPILDLMRDDFFFIGLLSGYFNNQFPLGDDLKSGIKIDREMDKLNDLIRNLDVSNVNQTMAFHKVRTYNIYYKKIVSVSNFTLNRSSKLINDLRSTSTLYDVVLPFHNKNYDGTSTVCKRVQDLPGFFSLPW